MKEIGKILAYLLATVILGALLAPPLLWIGQWISGHGILPFLGETPFQRYFSRAVLIAAVILLWPLVRWLDVRGVTQVTMRRDPNGWKNLAFGLMSALVLMAALGALLVHLEIYRLKAEIPYGRLSKVVLSAAGASVAEEFLFRGMLLGLVARASSKTIALIFTSALYSIVHFLKTPDEAVTEGAVNLLSGFILIPGAFWQFRDPLLVAGGFTTLLVLGLVLGYAALRTHSLWLPIGIHAGMICGKFGFTKLAKRRGDPSLWFGENLEVGFGALLVMALLAFIVWWWLKDANSRRIQDGG